MSAADPFDIPVRKLPPAWTWALLSSDEVRANGRRWTLPEPQLQLDDSTRHKLSDDAFTYAEAVAEHVERRAAKIITHHVPRLSKQDEGRWKRRNPETSRLAYEMAAFCLWADWLPDRAFAAVGYALGVGAMMRQRRRAERLIRLSDKLTDVDRARVLGVDDRTIRLLRKHESVRRRLEARDQLLLDHPQQTLSGRLTLIDRKVLCYPPFEDDVVGRVLAGSQGADAEKTAAREVAWHLFRARHPDALTALGFAIGVATEVEEVASYRKPKAAGT